MSENGARTAEIRPAPAGTRGRVDTNCPRLRRPSRGRRRQSTAERTTPTVQRVSLSSVGARRYAIAHVRGGGEMGHNEWYEQQGKYSCRADMPQMGRGGAAAATWIFRGDESRRRRGCHVNILRRRDAAAATWRFRGDGIWSRTARCSGTSRRRTRFTTLWTAPSTSRTRGSLLKCRARAGPRAASSWETPSIWHRIASWRASRVCRL